MTPARKAALQWFAERAPLTQYKWASSKGAPSRTMLSALLRDERLRLEGGVWIQVTDKGRRDLREAKP